MGARGEFSKAAAEYSSRGLSSSPKLRQIKAYSEKFDARPICVVVMSASCCVIPRFYWWSFYLRQASSVRSALLFQ